MSGSTRMPRGGRYVRVALLAIAALFVARIAVGAVLGGAIHPVTVLAVIAGMAGGATAITVSGVLAADRPPWERLWRTAVGENVVAVGDAAALGENTRIEDGTSIDGDTPTEDGTSTDDGPPAGDDDSTALDDWRRPRLQLLFFAVAGGIYPWVLAPVLGIPGVTWAAVPNSIGTGVLWAGGTFAVAAVTYLVTDTLTASVADVRGWLATAAGHLAFGLVFGAVIGLWRPFFLV